MSIFAFLMVGMISGFLAGKIVEGHGFGAFGDVIVGIVGAFVGGFFFTNSSYLNSSFTGAILTSTLGAILFLLVSGLFHAAARPRRV